MAEKIKVDFLGTGSAIPTSRRNHPCVLLRYKDEAILFDCGEGTQRQFRKAKLNPCKVTRIFISHWHGDHVLGLPGLLQTLSMNGYNEVLEIHGPKGTKRKFSELIEPHLKFYLDLARKEGSKFDIKLFEHNFGKVIEEDEFEIHCTPTDHFINGLSYSFVLKEKKRIDKEKLEKLKLPNSPLIGELLKGKTVEINGKKIDGKKLIYVEKSRKFTYISDTRHMDSLIDFSRDSDVLVCESTYNEGEEEMAEKYFHMCANQAGKIAKVAKVKKLILFHLSQRYDEIPKVMVDSAKKFFKEVSVAEDLDKIIF